jgi:hypothetical protein
MFHMGKRYNTAWLVPERNNHGNTTITELTMRLKYPYVYVERVREPPNKIRKRYGWLTTRTNKGDIVNVLLAEMRDGSHGLKSRGLFEEMMSFKKEEQKYGAEPGKFDDRVDAIMIAKYVLPDLKPTQTSASNGATIHEAGNEPPVGVWIV